VTTVPATALTDTDVTGGESVDAALSLRNLTVYFHKGDRRITAVSGVSFDIRKRGFVSVLGPSGCGKSTILNCLAGLIRPSAGDAICDGVPVNGPNTSVGYLTQRDTLLPWLTVEENVRLPFVIQGKASGARVGRRWSIRSGNREVSEHVQGAIEMVGLAGFEKHYPYELSGGMLKRASLAQVLAHDKDIILMDEPFGALDAQLKLQMHRELMRIWHERTPTVMFVTHDIEEAVALSDAVIVLAAHPGRIQTVVPIDLPRPRDPVDIRFDPHFRELHEGLWSLLERPAMLKEPDTQ
jgi:NitT/TauT family transport system ATP-binding protein